MYCLKCGKKIDDNASFCPYCGTQQKKINSHSNSNPNEDNNNKKENKPSPNKESNNDEDINTVNLDSDEDQDLFFGDLSSDYDVDDNNEDENEDNETQRIQHKATYNTQFTNNQNRSSTNRPMGLFIAIGAIIVAIIVVLIIVLSNSKPTIDMNKYLVVTDEGYNEYGSINYYIDYTQLYNDYAGKLKLTSEGNNNYIFSRAMIVNGEDPVEMICDNLSVYPDVYFDLSNGDKVTFTWDDSEISMIETYIKVSIKAKDYTYTVSNLEDIEKDDFFNYISIEYSGTAPNGSASVIINEDCDWLDSYDFSIDNANNLSNGDTINVTIDDYALQNIIYQYGKASIETEKEYTVEGLDEYITKISQIPDEDLEKIKQKGEDKINEIFNGDNDTINQITLLGYDLMKSGSRHESESCEIYAIYKINETIGRNDNFYTFDNYWYISFPDGYINGDGDFNIYYGKYFTPVIDSTNWWTGYVDSGEGWTYMSDDDKGIVNVPGFQTLKDLNNFIGAVGNNLLDSTVSDIST